MSHECNWFSPWPVGHPLPVEDPDRLEGPPVGTRVRYVNPRYDRWFGVEMTVTAQSYVWSPGECRSKGGYRNYDWSVVKWDVDNEGKGGTMVVNDEHLEVI